MLLLMLTLFCGSEVSSFPQGQIVFANNAAAIITNALTGSAWWESNPLYLRVAVYGANGHNQLESSLVFQPSAVTNLNAPGRFFGGTRELALPAGQVTLQVRAWGASTYYESYEDAVVAAFGGDRSVVIGTSPLFYTTLTAPLNPPTPIATQGLQPFMVNAIPEPSAWALGAMAIGLLFLSRFSRRGRHAKESGQI